MSEVRKSKKVVNSIGVGIMAVLSTGTSMMQLASAADVGEVQNAGEMLENEVKVTSMNQGTIDALDDAGDAGFDLKAVSSDGVDALNKTVTKLLRGAGVTDEWKNHTDLEPFSAA